MASEPVIYAPWNTGLGDQWACINLLLQKGVGLDSILLHSPPLLRNMHEAILSELPISRANLYFVDDAPTHHLSGYDVWATDYLPTRLQHQRRDAHKFCAYHFDGLSSAADKNPNPAEHTLLLRALAASGFTPVNVGLPFSIAQAVEILAHSAFFVGVDSGPAHIAHSTGVPMFLLEFGLPIITCHRGKSFIQCGSRHEGRYAVEEFLRHKLPTFIDYLRFIGHPDGERSTVPHDRAARDALDRTGNAWWVPNG